CSRSATRAQVSESHRRSWASPRRAPCFSPPRRDIARRPCSRRRTWSSYPGGAWSRDSRSSATCSKRSAARVGGRRRPLCWSRGRRAGARSVLLLPGEAAAPAELLARVDGLLLVGGGDVEPERYGQVSGDEIY